MAKGRRRHRRNQLLEGRDDDAEIRGVFDVAPVPGGDDKLGAAWRGRKAGKFVTRDQPEIASPPPVCAQ